MKKIVLLLMVLACTGTAFTAMAQVKKKAVTTAKKPISKTKAPVKKQTMTQSAKKTEAIKDNSIHIKITTDSGVLVVKLYDSTPLHRDNFARLVKEGFYDSLLFHRIIPTFMIQGGDPLSKNAQPGSMLGSGGGEMARIPAEFNPNLIHKKGALAAARDGNPQKASSACQFYLVEGKIATDAELDMMESRQGRKYSPEQREIYKTIGGTPFLDMNYTVFGEVISGIEVIEKISHAPRNSADRPQGDVSMKMEIVNP